MLSAADLGRATVSGGEISDLSDNCMGLDSDESPVFMVPSEIASEIFIHFLPAYPQCPPLTGILSPTTLTHICRKWREIAISTPALWRAISLMAYNGPSEKQAQISDLWLQRSCACPLSISIRTYITGEAKAVPFFRSVTPHRARWEYLKLDVLSSELAVIQSSMPLLRRLDVHISFSPNTVQLPKLPRLCSVILYRTAASYILHMPWVQLTSMALQLIPMDECIAILQQTSHLVHCALHIYYIRSHPDGAGVVVLPCLKSLVFAGLAPRTDYLTYFTTPALHRLQLPEAFLRPDPIHCLKGFILKSGCELQDMRITGKMVTSIFTYLEEFSSVGKLSFHHRDYNCCNAGDVARALDGDFDFNVTIINSEEEIDDDFDLVPPLPILRKTKRSRRADVLFSYTNLLGCLGSTF
ncbi:hypothetical protein B0H14DRAFT_1311188 [Mycena olivaceomarginata]|nr:hypothetical protein B0H14DRAFT_1311188 [Mycena olivaceomarginata]